MLTVAISKRNKLQNIIVLTPKDGKFDDDCIDYAVAIFLYVCHAFGRRN